MENLLTVQEVAPLVRLSEQGLYRSIREKQFPAIRIGNHIRIPESLLQLWISQQLSTSLPSYTSTKHNESG